MRGSVDRMTADRAYRMEHLSGPRVTLADFIAEDVAAVHAFAGDPDVCAFTTWGPNTPAETAAFVGAALHPQPNGFLLAVMSAGEVIGSASVWTTSEADRAGELGYTLRRDRWGRGYGTEVAGLLMRLGFERLGLERLAATCAPENTGSVRVLEKAGMRREGLLRGHLLVRGHRRDSLLYARLRSDG